MTSGDTGSARSSEIAVSDELPGFDLAVTSMVIVAAAIASRDFVPAHNHPELAKAQGAPDTFMNVPTTNGYVARFVTDWAGPEAMVRSIAIRLGAPAIPGQPLRFRCQVTKTREDGDERIIEMSVRAANDLGDHATGTVIIGLPLS